MASEKLIERLARIVHEANRAYCIGQGDMSQKDWDDTPEDIRESVRNGVRAIIDDPNHTPEQSHETWMAYKAAQGWVFGDTKDAEKKTHPSMIPYNELSNQEKFKDALFHGIVHTYLDFTKK